MPIFAEICEITSFFEAFPFPVANLALHVGGTSMYGISFSVNENLAISYNVVDNTYKNTAGAADVNEETTGFGASYTMGSAAVRLLTAKTDNVGGTAGTNEEVTELSLMLAF